MIVVINKIVNLCFKYHDKKSDKYKDNALKKSYHVNMMKIYANLLEQCVSAYKVQADYLEKSKKYE